MTDISAGIKVPVPEPELTPGDMLARASGLREQLRAEQPATSVPPRARRRPARRRPPTAAGTCRERGTAAPAHSMLAVMLPGNPPMPGYAVVPREGAGMYSQVHFELLGGIR